MSGRNRFLWAIGATCWSVVAAGGQTAPSTLSASLRAHLESERFQVVTSVRGLPLGVREELQRMFGSSATAIAEPGAPFQAADDISDPTLPVRRMAVAGCSQDHCLVYYERGGIARTRLVALFRWTPAMTRFEGGGTAPGGLASVDDVRSALLSGLVKSSPRGW